MKADYKIDKKNNSKTLILTEFPEFHNLPNVSLITITKNREIFYPVMLNNYFNFKYPFTKIEWIILDDGDNDNSKTFEKYNGIKYIYAGKNYYDSIAKKRNDAVKIASHDIIIHYDDDDYYFPNSLYSKVKLLLMKNKSDNIECIGTTDYPIYNLLYNNSYLYKNSYIGEATLCYYKSFWEKKQFHDHFNGEGYAFLKNRYSKVCLISYENNIIVINHNSNYTKNNRCYDEIKNNEALKFFDNKTLILYSNIRKILIN